MKSFQNNVRLACYLLTGMFLLNSCNSGSSTNETMKDSATTSVQTPPDTGTAMASNNSSTTQKLTDPEIASIALAADQIDIDNGELAKSKTKDADVKKFAETMIKDHTSVNDQAKALASKLNLTPQDNSTTQTLMSNAATTKEMLKSKSGADFDKAYIDNEVAYHKAAIDLVENTLIPDATNDQLKSLLQSALPIFKEHLSHAEMLQKKMSK